MSGTETAAEGLPGFRVSTLRAADSSVVNSLEGGFQVSTIQNGVIAYVVDSNVEYRWFEDSLTAPVDPTVIIPLGQSLATPGRWILVAGGDPVGDTEFDFILTSRADLVSVVAPVGDVFNLPAGSYFVKTSFSLNEDERIEVNTDVRISGGGVGKVLSGSSTVFDSWFITLDGGELIIDNVGISTADAMGSLLILDGSLRVTNVEVQSIDESAFYNWLGDSRLESSTFTTANVPAMSMTGGNSYATMCKFSSAGGSGVTLIDEFLFSGSIRLHNCEIESGTAAQSSLTVLTPNIHATVVGGVIRNTADVAGFGVGIFSAGGFVSLSNVDFESQASCHGISIQGDVDMIRVSNCNFYGAGIGIQNLAAGVYTAVLDGLYFDVNCGFGVDWDAVDIPFNGLLEVGIISAIDANTFINHNEATPGVNRKACQGFGLAAETPIVP